MTNSLSLSHSLSFSFVCVCVCVSVKILKFRIECDTSTEHWDNQFWLSLLCVWNLCPSVCVIVCVWFALKKNYRVNFIDQLSDVKITLMCNVYKSFQSDFFGVQIGVFFREFVMSKEWVEKRFSGRMRDFCIYSRIQNISSKEWRYIEVDQHQWTNNIFTWSMVCFSLIYLVFWCK